MVGFLHLDGTSTTTSSSDGSCDSAMMEVEKILAVDVSSRQETCMSCSEASALTQHTAVRSATSLTPGTCHSVNGFSQYIHWTAEAITPLGYA